MSWHGPYSKGASRERRMGKRAEAEQRQQEAILNAHPDGVCTCHEDPRTHTRVPDAMVEQLILDMFAK